MSQGRWVASAELEGPGAQPQAGEQGRGAGYAHREQGLDRTFLRKGSSAHASQMGTSQQLSSPPRKGETLDVTAGRDLASPKPVTVRPSSNYGGCGPPVVAVPHHATRAISRPPHASSPFGNMLSPRNHQATSYRDAALAAAQHGLSAYAHSAAAVAAAARGHTPRSGAGASAGSGAGAGGGGSAAGPGRPPPVPRPMQHSAPTPIASTTSNSGTAAEFLPSCSGASPSRISAPTTRAPALLPSRGSMPSPSSPGRGGEAAPAFAASAASSTPPGNYRTGEVAMVTVTCNDVWWRGAFDGSAIEPDDHLFGGVGVGGNPPRPLSGTASAVRVMSPGWGMAPPSVYEADGRPGTRGGGPQFDIDGRPMTRSGQRPPSRAQLNLALQRPPAHVAPLGGPGWAGLFAGGCGPSGPAEAVPPPPPPPYTSPQRAPSAGASISWSGGDAIEPPGSLRRQLVSLPPPFPAAAAAARLSSPPARVFGSGSGGAAGSPGGLLKTPLTQPSQSSTPSASTQSPPNLPPWPSPGVGFGIGVGSSNSSSNGGMPRAQPVTKLSSIAEAPGSPVLQPLPPPQQQPQQQQQYFPKTTTGRTDAGVGGGWGGGRKAPREREGSFTAMAGDGDACQFPGSPGGVSARAPADQDLHRSNSVNDSPAAAGCGGSGGGGGGGGRAARLRRSSSNSLGGPASSSSSSSFVRTHGSVTGDNSSGFRQGLAGHGGLQTDETPSIRPRR